MSSVSTSIFVIYSLLSGHRTSLSEWWSTQGRPHGTRQGQGDSHKKKKYVERVKKDDVVSYLLRVCSLTISLTACDVRAASRFCGDNLRYMEIEREKSPVITDLLSTFLSSRCPCDSQIETLGDTKFSNFLSYGQNPKL